MKRIILAFIIISTVIMYSPPEVFPARPGTDSKHPAKFFGLVIHGGAGTILKSKMTPQREKLYHGKLSEALALGYKMLKAGRPSLLVVEKVINVLENSPLFNAARGAVFTYDGTNELDASIMDGKTLNAGAVAGVTGIKNPINLARLVMNKSPHVLLSGKGAREFAQINGIKTMPPSYFFDKSRWDQLLKSKKQKKSIKGMIPPSGKNQTSTADEKFGTVGAVALDVYGNLAAGTSTGGMTGKRFGRIGDSPIIGAGTYADNTTCAVSSTGHGEFFIRAVVAYDISALMKYKGMSLNDAAEEVVNKKLVRMKGTGGIIGIDNQGNIAMVFNTKGMYRGYIKMDGKIVTKLYRE